MHSPAVSRRDWCLAGIAASFLLFSWPTIWFRRTGAWPSYLWPTLALASVWLAVAVLWPTRAEAPQRPRARLVAVPVACAALLLVAAAARDWIDLILVRPIDPNLSDMLPVVRLALGRFVRGHNPYGVYQVPWDAAMAYGPVLWAPYLGPYLLNVDLRTAGVAGQLVVPIWCAIAATIESVRGRIVAAVLWVLVAAAIVWNPDLAAFTPVAHTPVYWVLFPLFALFVRGERWRAAAVVLGLLVAGRTTMIAGVPIFFTAVWWRARRSWAECVVAWLAPIAVLFLPFAIADPGMLWYCMAGVYVRVVQPLVWSDPGLVRTFGATGWLVVHGLGRLVAPLQALTMLAVYGGAWRAVRRGSNAVAWIVVALLGFCMTTIWPVYYLFFDALLLGVSAAVADVVDVRPLARQLAAWAATVAAAVALVAGAVRLSAAPYPRLDFTQEASRRWLYQGATLSGGPGEPGLAWIWGYDASVMVPRSSRSAVAIRLAVEPVIPDALPQQTVTVVLNGRPIGTGRIGRGWQTLEFPAPRQLWTIGANELTITCGSVARPIEIGMNSDTRQLSLAIRSIDVVPAEESEAPR